MLLVDVLVEPSDPVFRKTQWHAGVDEYNKARLDAELFQRYELAGAAAELRQTKIMEVNAAPGIHVLDNY